MIIMLEICKAALGVLCHVSNSNVMSAKPHHKQQPFSCRHEKKYAEKPANKQNNRIVTLPNIIFCTHNFWSVGVLNVAFEIAAEAEEREKNRAKICARQMHN